MVKFHYNGNIKYDKISPSYFRNTREEKCGNRSSENDKTDKYIEEWKMREGVSILIINMTEKSIFILQRYWKCTDFSII